MNGRNLRESKLWKEQLREGVVQRRKWEGGKEEEEEGTAREGKSEVVWCKDGNFNLSGHTLRAAREVGCGAVRCGVVGCGLL